MKIGTPGVTVNLDFDTGSSDLWIWSSELADASKYSKTLSTNVQARSAGSSQVRSNHLRELATNTAHQIVLHLYHISTMMPLENVRRRVSLRKRFTARCLRCLVATRSQRSRVRSARM